jgi:hypothetical protein
MMKFWVAIKYAVLCIVILLLVVLVVLGYLTLTGHTERAYPVLDPEAFVTINSKELKPLKMAQLYQPLLNKRLADQTPPLLWIYYEVVNNEMTDVVDINYYYVWQDEVSPNGPVNFLYSIFRMAYYGYPLYDIEYFQVCVDKNTGMVKKLRFETTPYDDFKKIWNDHMTAHYFYSGNGEYDLTMTDGFGRPEIIKQNQMVEFAGNRVLTGLATWNHLTKLIYSSTTDTYQAVDADLKPLTNRDYVVYKFVRKSQGDFKTDETIIDRIFLSIVCAIFIYTVGLKLKTVIIGKTEEEQKEK